MRLFAVFTLDLDSINKTTYTQLNDELADLGLKKQIYDAKKHVVELPVNTYIGEYEFDDMSELKNTLYTEIKSVFGNLGLTGTIFISVSERAVIGVEKI